MHVKTFKNANTIFLYEITLLAVQSRQPQNYLFCIRLLLCIYSVLNVCESVCLREKLCWVQYREQQAIDLLLSGE